MEDIIVNHSSLGATTRQPQLTTMHLDKQFRDLCISVAAALKQDSYSPPTSLSPTTTTFSPTASLLHLKSGNVYPGYFSDFHGLPSNPRCVYRTGPAWRVPQGPEAQPYLREARPVCDHPIRETWHNKLGVAVYEHLDSVEVRWSTIDLVRFAEAGRDPGPLHLWIGVNPGTLSLEDAKKAAEGCKRILANFPDVEVAFRESVYTQSTSSQLLEHVSTIESTADVRGPFTPALGLKIAPRTAPRYEGTGALYFRKESGSDEVLVLTNHHVALPPPVFPSNTLYRCTNRSTPTRDVVLLGTKAHELALKAILAKIGYQFMSIEAWEGELGRLGEAVEAEAPRKTKTREGLQYLVDKAMETITELNAFHEEVTRHWSNLDQRILGYVLHAPPISVGTGPQRFTEDWAMLNIYLDKINWNEFQGNVIDLTKISPPEFVVKMRPNSAGRDSFKFPPGGLLQVEGFVPESEIRQPEQLDANDEERLIVLKNGNTTGVTFGRGTGLESFVRTYSVNGIAETSIELAVYPYGNKEGPFSAPGDSGSIVVDGRGRIVGMLSGGSGLSDSTDVTYLTPYFWLEQRIKEVFPNCYLFPIVD